MLKNTIFAKNKKMSVYMLSNIVLHKVISRKENEWKEQTAAYVIIIISLIFED